MKNILLFSLASLAFLAMLSGCQTTASTQGAAAETVTPCPDARPEMCTQHYDPVCGIVKSGTTRTFSNACHACADTAVEGFRAGPCAKTSPDETRGSPDVAPVAAATFVYHCEPALRFVARVDDQRAWLFLPDQTIDLPQVPSGSGARYAKADTVFWSKGEEAMLELGERRYRNCRNDRRAAIWEHAKLNGVSFRGIGNEPPWVLEIFDGGRIDLRTGYEGRLQRFTDVRIDVDADARETQYTAQGDGHDLTIDLVAGPCRDSMSGEPFATQVTVRLDDRELRGCGRPLH